MAYSLQQEQRQSVKQVQRMMISPEMQQALYLLQVPTVELQALLSQELEQNPMLERLEERGDEYEESGTDEEKSIDLEEIGWEVFDHLDESFREHISQDESPFTIQDEKRRNYKESLIQGTPSLYSQLMDQAREMFGEELERAIAEEIVGKIFVVS